MQRPYEERLRPLPLPVYTCRSNGFAHMPNAPCSNSVVSQKKGESCIVDCSTTFPRLSRAGRQRNGEDAANLPALLRLRFAENCADHALHDVSRCCDC